MKKATRPKTDGSSSSWPPPHQRQDPETSPGCHSSYEPDSFPSRVQVIGFGPLLGLDSGEILEMLWSAFNPCHRCYSFRPIVRPDSAPSSFAPWRGTQPSLRAALDHDLGAIPPFTRRTFILTVPRAVSNSSSFEFLSRTAGQVEVYLKPLSVCLLEAKLFSGPDSTPKFALLGATALAHCILFNGLLRLPERSHVPLFPITVPVPAERHYISISPVETAAVCSGLHTNPCRLGCYSISEVAFSGPDRTPDSLTRRCGSRVAAGTRRNICPARHFVNSYLWTKC